MIYEKPKNEIFASDAKDGEIVDFPNVKRGWGVTENLGFIPPMEYFNAAFNRVDKSLAYQLQRGVSEWVKDLEYPIGAVVSLNENIYIAKSQNTNKSPASEAEVWDAVATKKWSDNKFALKDDLPSLATETKAGITKLKNSITAQQEDAAVTEKAVREFVDQHIPPSIGVGQTWQDVTSQRQANITYTNTTGKPIFVHIQIDNAYNAIFNFTINGLSIRHDENARAVMDYIVPAGAIYKLAPENGANHNVHNWYELR